MDAQVKGYSIEAFDSFIRQPENINRAFEYIGGEVVEVVSNPYSSKVAALIVAALVNYLKQNDIGHVTGADGGYMVSGERYIPDVAFISYDKQPDLNYREGYLPHAPDLAIEVLSPSNEDDVMTVKVANYLAAETIVWMVKPQEQQVMVFMPGKPVVILGIDDLLNGGDVLPGLQLAVREIFPTKRDV